MRVRGTVVFMGSGLTFAALGIDKVDPGTTRSLLKTAFHIS
jgi:hypothetical protein